jgi:hypothetical protein
VRRIFFALVLLLAAPAAAAPTIELYTMGRSDDLFSAFGHAAICVHDARAPWGRCYNYGTADFTTPVPLTINFVRGRAMFWVSVLDQPRMLAYYSGVGRSVWRQPLTLPPDQAEALAAALEASTDEKAKYYRYHHFDDNCTTRIRDLVDRATGGALRRDPVDRGRSFRQWARDGFAGNWPLLVATELFLGRSSDRHTDTWTAMFLPSELRDVVEARLGARPELIVRGRYGPPDGSRWSGQLAFVIGGLLLAALILGGTWLGRRWSRAALVITGIALGLVALVLDTLALLSTFPELTHNEALLIFWPTDLLLGVAPRRWLQRYAAVRLIALAILLVAHLGLLRQPIAPLFLAAFPMGALYAVAGTEKFQKRS